MISNKQIKELESKIHAKLHDHIKLLTHTYPTTKDFDSVFKKNMFAKSNKAAFQHVTYYLFTVLNPELTKERITAWPLYDARLESTFRNEVVALIHHINSEYEHANIPNLMTSHLVSPGGIKIARFIWKFSMLVVYEHLKKGEFGPELIASVRPHKDPNVTNMITMSLKARTGGMEAEVDDMWGEFRASYDKAAEEAERIVKEQDEIEKKLYNANKLLAEKKKSQSEDKTLIVITQRLRNLQERILDMMNIKEMCLRCKELLIYLLSDKPILEFKKEDFVVPDKVKNSLKSEDELDLCQLFNSLSIFLEKESLDMPILTTDRLNSLKKILTDLNERYSQIDQKLGSHRNELVELSENFHAELDDTCKVKHNPLILSPTENNSCNL